MKVIITDITGVPPFHLYKNARVLLLDIECECGEHARKTYIIEDKPKGKNNEDTRNNREGFGKRNKDRYN